MTNEVNRIIRPTWRPRLAQSEFTSDGKVFAAVNSGCDLFEPSKRVEDTERIIAEDIRYVTDILNILRGAFTG